MKKNNILKKTWDFDRIIKHNQPIKYKNYIIYLERNTNDVYHFGLSVGKKVGNAVVRNKIKRQLKNIIDQKDYQNNFNCIIIVRKEIIKETYDDMKNNLYYIFNKISIIEETGNEKKFN